MKKKIRFVDPFLIKLPDLSIQSKGTMKRIDQWIHAIKKHPRLREALEHIVHPEHSPQATAFSIAAGIFIGIFIPVGLQLATTLLISPLKKINLILTSLATLISNPFTVLPLYWIGIMTGEYVTGHTFPWHVYDRFMNNPGFKQFVDIGMEGLFVLMSGLLVLAVPATLLTYLISLNVARWLRARHSGTPGSQGS